MYALLSGLLPRGSTTGLGVKVAACAAALVVTGGGLAATAQTLETGPPSVGIDRTDIPAAPSQGMR